MKGRLLLIVILLLTATVFVLTWKQITWYGSFYAYRNKPSGSVVVKLVLAGCLSALAFLATRKVPRAWGVLSAGVLIGTVLQFGFAYTEGRGFDGIRARAHAGHGQFIAVALETSDPLDTVRHYEELAAQGKLRQFPRTKPPGTLLFYILSERVAEFIHGPDFDPTIHERHVVDFLSTVWPFVAALAILPLYWLTVLLRSPGEARLAVALYLTVPSFVLVTLHTDQVLFPFLFLSVLCLFVWSLRATTWAARISRGAGAGAMLWLASFCDFPLALSAVFCLGVWIADVRADARSRGDALRRGAAIGGAMAAGVVVPSLAAWVVAGYNPVVRWHAAIAFHAAWRHVPAVVGLRIGWSNVFESIDWAGVPVTVLALAVLWRRSASGETGKPNYPAAIMLSLLALVAYLAFFSRTAAETARLWLFLVPELCVAAATTLSDLRTRQRLVVPAILALQFATVYLIKMTHDFW